MLAYLPMTFQAKRIDVAYHQPFYMTCMGVMAGNALPVFKRKVHDAIKKVRLELIMALVTKRLRLAL